MSEVNKKVMEVTMGEVNTLVGCGIAIGVGLCMFISSSIQLYQLEKGTHETQKEYNRGFKWGKLIGKMEATTDMIKADIEESKRKQELEKAEKNSEITKNETESD